MTIKTRIDTRNGKGPGSTEDSNKPALLGFGCWSGRFSGSLDIMLTCNPKHIVLTLFTYCNNCIIKFPVNIVSLKGSEIKQALWTPALAVDLHAFPIFDFRTTPSSVHTPTYTLSTYTLHPQHTLRFRFKLGLVYFHIGCKDIPCSHAAHRMDNIHNDKYTKEYNDKCTTAECCKITLQSEAV